MSKKNNTSGMTVDPTTKHKVITNRPSSSHWPADKAPKKNTRSDSGESQDADRHKKIRHENSEK